jgi:hypothetical protein
MGVGLITPRPKKIMLQNVTQGVGCSCEHGKMFENSWVGEQLAASQEGLSSMELVPVNLLQYGVMQICYLLEIMKGLLVFSSLSNMELMCSIAHMLPTARDISPLDRHN